MLESPLHTLDETIVIMGILDEVRRQIGVVYPQENETASRANKKQNKSTVAKSEDDDKKEQEHNHENESKKAATSGRGRGRGRGKKN